MYKACGVFGSVELTFFMNSFISCGKALPQVIDASDFAIREVSFNPNKGGWIGGGGGGGTGVKGRGAGMEGAVGGGRGGGERGAGVEGAGII